MRYYTGPFDYENDSVAFARNAVMRTLKVDTLELTQSKIEKFSNSIPSARDSALKYKSQSLELIDSILKTNKQLKTSFMEYRLYYQIFYKTRKPIDRGNFASAGSAVLKGLEKELKPLDTSFAKLKEQYNECLLRLNSQLDSLMIRSNALLTDN